MERTTIYLDLEMKKTLFEVAAKVTAKTGKHFGMAELIREAIVEYLERKGYNTSQSDSRGN